MEKIAFHKPYLSGREPAYFQEFLNDIENGDAGRQKRICTELLAERLGSEQLLLTHSCTAALEISAHLADITPGDEVIIPNYSYVSTANAFALRGGKLMLADSEADHPNISIDSIASLISDKTKAIVVLHYAGMSCDMNALRQLVGSRPILIVEDAAHGLGASYDGRPLGTLGDVGCFSFHHTKNVSGFQGGLLCVNNEKLWSKALRLYNRGTNRAEFDAGKTTYYGWQGLGSAYEIALASTPILRAQLEDFDLIQSLRQERWQEYSEGLAGVSRVSGPRLKSSQQHSAHIYYFVCKSHEERERISSHLAAHGIPSYFHYVALNGSENIGLFQQEKSLIHSQHFSECLLRLPIHTHLSKRNIGVILELLSLYCKT